MSTPPIPIAEKDEQGHVRVRWDGASGTSCMPIVQLTKDGDDLSLPGRLGRLNEDDVATLQCAIFLAERRSGTDRLVRWLLQHCRLEGVCVRAPEGALIWSPAAERQAKAQQTAKERKRQGEWVATLRHLSTSDAGSVDALVPWLTDRKTPFLLVLRLNDSQRSFERTREFVSRLRGCYEEHRDRLRIVLVTSWPDLVIDTLEHSGFLSISDAYRLASFGLEEIRAMAAGFPHLGGEVVNDNTLRDIRTITGGQPHLVDCLLQELAQIASHHTSADTKGDTLHADLPLAQHRIAHSPPAIVTIWQDHLASLLRQHPELRLPLERYVEGQKLSADLPYRYPPPRHEWHLYAAGWVGPDARAQEWGMRSWLHQEWARQILAGGRNG